MEQERIKLLGRRLKEARYNARLSQYYVADMLRTSRQDIASWEAGEQSPTAIQLSELAAVYCVCAHALLFGTPFEIVNLGALTKIRRDLFQGVEQIKP